MSLELEVESVFDKASADLWEAIQNDKIKYIKTEGFRVSTIKMLVTLYTFCSLLCMHSVFLF